ncbi:hypothetical protein I3843_13G097600 [Carya illinoinensis]|nr:hypothetical protein I3843_13G097600 [Carya illinoinensis]
MSSWGGVNDGRPRFEPSDSLLLGLVDDVALNCLALASRSDYTFLSCINTKFNGIIKSGCLYGLRKQLGIVEHWVYLVCDPRGWEVFDHVRKKWMALPRMPCDECFNHADKESLVVGSELLVKCQGMNRSRCLFGSSSLGSISIAAGGSDKHGNIVLCFFMDGKLYVIGGMLNPTVPLTCGEEYDLQTKKWRKIEDMYPLSNGATQAPPLVAVVDNQLYAIEHLTNMDVLRRLPVRANLANGWDLAFKACGEELLVVGGQRGPEGEGIVLNSWCPKSEVNDGILDWKVLGVKEHVGVFVYNCTVMGC